MDVSAGRVIIFMFTLSIPKDGAEAQLSPDETEIIQQRNKSFPAAKLHGILPLIVVV